jgi:succinate-semialdehyde dehydrogenase/glutarate-semialdehyde dehydrogenase
MAIATVNPATGETIREFDELTDAQVQEKLQRAADAFREFRTTTYTERARLLNRAADILDAEADELGRIAALEVGKTLASAIAEVGKCAKGCRWFAEHTEAILADSPHDVPYANVFTRYRPLGPVLAITPWNFPYWQVLRFAAPALMAGDVGLLKHASNVAQVALAIEDVLHRAGFPEGVFQTLLVGSKKIEGIIDDDRVRALTLTGSEPAGRQVGATAGRTIKPTGRATTTRRPTSRRARPRTARSCSVRSRCSGAPATSTTPSGSPTTPRSAWAAARGPGTRSSRSGSPPRSRPG